MSQMARENKHSNDNTTPVFTSPDGVRIRINRGGNKMQFIRDLCRNKEITDVQFRILVPLVDTSNEGTDDDCSRWGKSWLSLQNLALESGCSKRAVEKNLPKLEAAGIVNVTRDVNDKGQSKGGRSNVNEYWLIGWNRFGAIRNDEPNSERRSPFDEKNSECGTEKRRTVELETANEGLRNSERRSPDSTHLPNPREHNPSTQPAASRRNGPVGFDFDDAGKERLQAGNDNHDDAKSVMDDSRQETQPVKDNEPNEDTVRYRKSAEEVWLMFHKAPPNQHDQFIRLFVDLAKAGEIKSSEEVRYGLKCHIRDTEPKYQKSPVSFLEKQVWKTYRKPASGSLRDGRRAMAI